MPGRAIPLNWPGLLCRVLPATDLKRRSQMITKYRSANGGAQVRGRRSGRATVLVAIALVALVAVAAAWNRIHVAAVLESDLPAMAAGGAPLGRRGRRAHSQKGAIAKSGPGSAALGDRPRGISPSHMARPARFDRWVIEIQEVLRREIRVAATEGESKPDWAGVPIDEEEVEELALAYVRRQLALLVDAHELDIDVDLLFLPGSAKETQAALRAIAKAVRRSPDVAVDPDPDGTRDAIEAHAIRSTATHRRVIEHLTRRQAGGSDYSLARAVLEAMWLIRGDMEFRRRWHEFTHMNLMWGWAFGMPCAFAPGEGGRKRSARSEDGVRQALFGRRKWKTLSNGLRELKKKHQRGLLDRHDPSVLLKANAEYVAELKRVAPEHMREFGKHTAMDSFRLRASAEQRQSCSEQDEKSLNGFLECTLGTHGDKAWRGWMFTTLIDVRTKIPIAWLLIKASANEADHLRELLALAHEHFPDLAIETVTADMALDSEPTYRVAEQEFGIHLIADLSRTFSPEKYTHGKSLGCPVHTCGEPYRLKHSVFHDSTKRRALRLDSEVFDRDVGVQHAGGTWFEVDAGDLVIHRKGVEHRYPLTRDVGQRNNDKLTVRLTPGQDVRHLIVLNLIEAEHIRWVPMCGCDDAKEIRTFPAKNWRLYTWAPRHDVHEGGRPDRFALRRELTSDHKGVIEGYHGLMRNRGIGTDGLDAPRAPITERAIEWLHFGRAVRITARKLVRLDGTYARSQRLAEDLGLLRPPTWKDLLRHADAEHDEPPEAWEVDVPNGM